MCGKMNHLFTQSEGIQKKKLVAGKKIMGPAMLRFTRNIQPPNKIRERTYLDPLRPTYYERAVSCRNRNLTKSNNNN